MTKDFSELFSEFPEISTGQWEEAIYHDLKGADYAKKLISRTLENIDIKPYYRSEDLETLNYLNSKPGEFPYVRGTKTNNEHEIRQNIYVETFAAANIKALDILNKGVTSLGFIICRHENISLSDINVLLKDIDLSAVSIHFSAGKISLEILKLYSEIIKQRAFDKSKIRGSVNFDPIGFKTITGNCYDTQKCNGFEVLKELVEFADINIPNFKVLTINGQYFREGGSTAVQEIGYALSMASEYLTKASENGISLEKLIPKMTFNFGIGADYFIEIAKIRTARLLWAKIAETYCPENSSIGKMFIHSITCDCNKTTYDPYVNLLRATTESMSAIIGGTDSLTVKPFDSIYKKSNDFSERIARNIQIILKEESYFDKTVDAAAGSYYVENLTNSLAENSWNLFLQVENSGGYLNSIEKGSIQERIEDTAKHKDMNLAQRKETLLGTNQYANLHEQIKDSIDWSVYGNENKHRNENPKSKPLAKYRGAKAFEELRLKTEKAAKRPSVFMFTFGNPLMRKARASFSANFFSCAGFEIIDNFGFKTIEEGIKAALDKKSEIVVICSSDDEYATIVPEIYKELHAKTNIVVAGHPECIDQLKAIGIQHFVHLKSNVLDTLNQFSSILDC